MSSTIDWSKAPEGATHLYQDNHLTYWMREVSYGTGWEFWSDGKQSWVKDTVPFPQYHTPRPAEPKIDWSKAPYDATHYQPEDDKWCACWVKPNYSWRIHDQNEWHSDGVVNARIREGKAVPRPAEPQEPTPWNGEGLPPVGTVCEFHDLYPKDDEWHKDLEPGTQVTVIAHYDNAGMLVAAFTFGQPGINMAVDCAVEGWFRPIKTAEQIAAEERSAAISEILADSGVTDSAFKDDPEAEVWAAALYDAGYRKVERP